MFTSRHVKHSKLLLRHAQKYLRYKQDVIEPTDRDELDSPELGVEILSALYKLYPEQFHLERAANRLANAATLDAIKRGDDPRSIAATWQPSLTDYKTAREPYLLYK